MHLANKFLRTRSYVLLVCCNNEKCCEPVTLNTRNEEMHLNDKLCLQLHPFASGLVTQVVWGFCLGDFVCGGMVEA